MTAVLRVRLRSSAALAVDTVIGSDAVMLVSLGTVKPSSRCVA